MSECGVCESRCCGRTGWKEGILSNISSPSGSRKWERIIESERLPFASLQCCLELELTIYNLQISFGYDRTSSQCRHIYSLSMAEVGIYLSFLLFRYLHRHQAYRSNHTTQSLFGTGNGLWICSCDATCLMPEVTHGDSRKVASYPDERATSCNWGTRARVDERVMK